MTGLHRWIATVALALLAFVGGVASGASPAAAQDRYYRYYDDAPRYERRTREPRYEERRVYDEDRALQQRMRYYSRDAVARREAARRAAYGERRRAAPRPQEGIRVPFLQRLFGSSQPDDDDEADVRAWGARPPVEVRPKPNRVRRKPAPVEAAPGAPGQPPADVAVPDVAAPPAAPPSVFVAVIGDSIADGLAAGLTEAFADAPEVGVKRFVKPNSGLVRDDYHDFVDVARKAVEGGPLAYAVIDVGVNDRQPFLDMRDAAPLTARWMARYSERIDAVLAPFKDKKIPIYWVGLAPSESRKASSDHTAINALAKERVEAAGGTYVDIWEGFVDETGDYADVGPQLDGQTVRLRLADGVHFSKAGARKLAHYVEQEIRKVFQPKAPTPADALISALPQGADGAPGDPNASPLIARPKPLAGPLVVLTAPRRAEGGALLGSAAAIPASADAAERTLVRGDALEADPGRLDDYRWPGAEAPAPEAKPGAAAAAAQPR